VSCIHTDILSQPQQTFFEIGDIMQLMRG
jgi:hypothetical protein